MVALEKGTLAYEIERIRLYIARAILDEIQVNNVTKDQVREIATEVLAATNQITEMAQIDPVLNALAAKYKVLVPAQVKQMVYEEEQIRSKAASELTNLLKQGKLEEAGDLAAKYLGDK